MKILLQNVYLIVDYTHLLLSVCLSGQFALDVQTVRINVTSLYIQPDTNNLCDSLACFVLVVSVVIRLISFRHRVYHY